MPAGGDNKPKLEKTINRAIAAVESDTHVGFIISLLALLIAIGSIIILVLAVINSLGGGSTSGGFVLLTIGALVASVAYLTRKLKGEQ